MADRFLDKVHSVQGDAERRGVYDAWAKTYEAELAETGYVTPQRCAQALQRYLPDPAAPILDIGCGTGLSGVALRMAGFQVVDGVDPSPGMLAEAKAKGIYRNLSLVGNEDAFSASYSAICAIGVIGAGAGPLSILDRIVVALPKGGLTAFSFNDHTLKDPSYQQRVDTLIESGKMVEKFREYGDHLPGMDMKAIVYVLEKT